MTQDELKQAVAQAAGLDRAGVGGFAPVADDCDDTAMGAASTLCTVLTLVVSGLCKTRSARPPRSLPTINTARPPMAHHIHTRLRFAARMLAVKYAQASSDNHSPSAACTSF